MKTTKHTRKNKTRNRGNKLGFKFFELSLHLFGLRGTYGFLYIVCLYYLLFDRSAVFSALSYIERRFPNSSFFTKYLHVYKLFVSQGKQLVDRHAAVAEEGIFDIQLKGYDKLVAVLRNSSQGIILLTSHIGNWQIALTKLNCIKRRIHLLMLPERNEAVQRSLRVHSEQDHIKIISPEKYLGGVIEIMNVLKKGDIVSIMGDRRYGAKGVEVSFIGDKAWFPYSAFTIAAAAGCPIVVLSSVKISNRRYIVDVSKILYPHYNGRKNKRRQLQIWVQQFAALIEKFTKRYPYQSFLFHDVWTEKDVNQDSIIDSSE